MSFTDLELKMLERVRPTPTEDRRMKDAVAKLQRALKKEIAKTGLAIEPVLVGSLAKGTQLRGADADMFLLFPPTVDRKELEKVGLELGKAVAKGEERYAEHPYLHGQFDGMEVDIVPSYKIDSPEQRMTAVDRTPFHTEFVLKHMQDGQRDDVRMLKLFMKGTGVYGAEAKIGGFSGYLVELLVLRYGSFRGTLQAASKWRVGEALDMGVKSPKKFAEPLVFIDPVDDKRNVAAALSAEMMAQFMQASRDYLDRANERFFFPRERKPMPIGDIERLMGRRGTEVIALWFTAPDVGEDTVWPQIKKCERALRDMFEHNGFRVMDSAVHASGLDMTVLIELESAQLPGVMRHEGPPIDVPNAAEFMEKWRENPAALSPPFIVGSRLCVDIVRKHCSARDLLESSIASLDLGAHLNEPLRASHKVLRLGELLREEKRGAMSALLDKRLPWNV
jgi:tRNA nucleotidyltransferase (CCA-adding enzyme)